MSERIYLDTNIYMDYFEERSDGIRPLDEFAFQLIKRAMGCEFEIVISDWVLEELKLKKEFKLKADILFDDLRNKNKLLQIDTEDSDIKTARSYKNWEDALHCILAKRAGCKFIVTRNISHLSDFSEIIQPKFPEQL